MNAQMTGQAVEYLRRSVERDKSADRDRGAGQRAANAAQAARDGVTIARTFDGDWGTSGGRGKREKRAAMAELIEAVRAGEVSRIYVHTTDRLARDVQYGMELWNACKDAGTLLRPGSQTFDPREPGYLTLWTVQLAQAEEDLDRMTRKIVDTLAWRVQHIPTCSLPGRPHMGRCHQIGCTDTTHCEYSHRIGHPFYGDRPGEDAEAVVAAHEEAGSVMGAARLLNARKVPTRMGGPWGTTTVRDVLVHRGAMPHRTRPGAKARAPFVLYGLLRCHCGHILTGSRYKNGSDPVYTSYKCHLARTVPGHGLSAVPEKRILPWVMAEAARLRVPEAVRVEADHNAGRSRLAARRLTIEDMYENNGPTWRDEYQRRISAVRADEAVLDAQEAARTVLAVPNAIDWVNDPPEAINAVLRALWVRVEMDSAMQPVRAEWTVPEWRAS